jgi:hypothetical protein
MINKKIWIGMIAITLASVSSLAVRTGGDKALDRTLGDYESRAALQKQFGRQNEERARLMFALVPFLETYHDEMGITLAEGADGYQVIDEDSRKVTERMELRWLEANKLVPGLPEMISRLLQRQQSRGSLKAQFLRSILDRKEPLQPRELYFYLACLTLEQSDSAARIKFFSETVLLETYGLATPVNKMFLLELGQWLYLGGTGPSDKMLIADVLFVLKNGLPEEVEAAMKQFLMVKSHFDPSAKSEFTEKIKKISSYRARQLRGEDDRAALNEERLALRVKYMELFFANPQETVSKMIFWKKIKDEQEYSEEVRKMRQLNLRIEQLVKQSRNLDEAKFRVFTLLSDRSLGLTLQENEIKLLTLELFRLRYKILPANRCARSLNFRD